MMQFQYNKTPKYSFNITRIASKLFVSNNFEKYLFIYSLHYCCHTVFILTIRHLYQIIG